MKVHVKFCYCCGKPCKGSLCENCLSLLPRVGAGGCRICSRPLWGLEGLCWSCRDLDVVLTKIQAPFYYAGLAKILMQQYKFRRGWGLTQFLVQELQYYLEPGYTLVPIPPKKQNLSKRGWDPVKHLWYHLKGGKNPGRILFEPVEAGEQKLYGRAKRKTMTSMENKAFLEIPTKIILLDDTITTGATLNSYARLLLEKGAQEVRGLAITLAP